MEEHGATMKPQTLAGLQQLESKALQKAETLDAAGASKQSKQRVNEEAKQVYRGLFDSVFEAGAAETPEGRLVMTGAIAQIDDYLAENGRLLNKKVAADFSALRARCDRLASSIQVRAPSIQPSGGVASSAGTLMSGGPSERSLATRRKEAVDLWYAAKDVVKEMEAASSPDAEKLTQTIAQIEAVLDEDGPHLPKTRVKSLQQLQSRARKLLQILAAPVPQPSASSGEIDDEQQEDYMEEAVSRRRRARPQRGLQMMSRLDEILREAERSPPRKPRRRNVVIEESDSE